MKFTVSSQAIKETLTRVVGAIANNPVLPILEDFLFSIEGRVLTVTTTDLEIFTQATLELDSAQGEGTIAIPAKIILDTIKQLPNQPITIDCDLESYNITVTSAFGQYEMTGENGADYPKVPAFDDSQFLHISSIEMEDIISKTVFATSNDELRPAMTGVCFDLKGENSSIVATDAHKLSKYSTDFDFSIEDKFIVPKRALSILKNVLSSDEVQVSWNDSNVFFVTPHQTIISRLIDANYPDYNAVFPKESVQVMEVNKNDLLRSLKRIANYTNKTTNATALELSNDKLVIRAEDKDYNNKANETLPVNYSGEPMTIGFNAKYLIEVLNPLNSERVIMSLVSSKRPAIIEELEGSTVQMLVMPVMLQS